MTNLVPHNPQTALATGQASPEDMARVRNEAHKVYESLSHIGFDAIQHATLHNGKIRSDRTRRVYSDTYNRWLQFCRDNKADPAALHAVFVKRFINDIRTEDGQPMTRATRLRMLSAMRTLLKAAKELSYDNPDVAAQYGALVGWLPSDENERKSPDKGKALRNGDVRTIFDRVAIGKGLDEPLATAGDALKAQGAAALEPINVRNTAIMKLLFYTWSRRFEIAALEWRDIDFDNRVITIRRAKGDKELVKADLGDATEALEQWRDVLFDQCDERTYVFPAVRKGGKIQCDKPISGNAIYNLCKKYNFAPHDARRTGITSALNAGTALNEAQAQAGHAQGSTTMGYAKGSDAKRRISTIKLGY